MSGNENVDSDGISNMADAAIGGHKSGGDFALLSADEQRSVAAILAIVADFAANRSAGSGNELEAMLVTAIAAKLPAGTHSQIIGEIFREVERRDRSGFTEFGAEQWERAKKEAKEEREARDQIADFAGDAQNTQQQRETEIARREAEYANVDVIMGDITMTGRNWRAAAMMMRDQSFRREMEAWAHARGYSDAQIEEAATVSEEIMLKNARGELLTPAEQQASEDNELVRENIRRAAERVQPGVTNSVDARASADSSNLASANASYAETRRNLLSGDPANPTPMMLSVTDRASVSAQLNSGRDFADAPSLTRSFANAGNATTALDVYPPQQIANMAPVAPSNAGGLDI